MKTLLRQLALVTESKFISFSDLTRVSAALQKQATRDLDPIWDVEATVDAFHTLEDVPLGYWPMIVMDDIGYDAAGIHLDSDRQPFALIGAGERWSLTASHEMLEMLVDPFGDRLVAGDSPKPDQGRVAFLVEVSDPSEAAEFGYTVNGVLVSDFYTPSYFDPVRAEAVRYSFTGAITEPRDVLRGGYLSWHDSVSDDWWQETWFDGGQSRFRNLGRLTGRTESIRVQIDRLTNEESRRALMDGQAAALTASRPSPQLVARGGASKAQQWRAQIASLLTPAQGVRDGASGTDAHAGDAGDLAHARRAPTPAGAGAEAHQAAQPHRRRPLFLGRVSDQSAVSPP